MQYVASDAVPPAVANAGDDPVGPLAQADPRPGSAAGRERDGEDWPEFLGPRGNGVSGERGLDLDWEDQPPPLLWSIATGTGYAAPSIVGSKLILFHRINGDERIECLDAVTGERLWGTAYRSNFSDPYGYNNGPRCAPLIAGDRCYTLGAEGRLRCSAMADGAVIWERDLLRDFNVPDSFFGIGATPILEGSRLIVAVGGQPNSGLVAFNSDDGTVLWESIGRDTWDAVETGWPSPVRYKWSGQEMVVSYASPIAVTINGTRHVFALMRHGLVCVDPATGAQRFHYWFRSRTHESVNAARPVIVDDTVMISASYRTGAARLRVLGDGSDYKVLWRDEANLETHFATAIYHDGHYYGFSGRHERGATLRCVDADTGQLVWESDGWERPLEDIVQRPNNTVVDARTGEVMPWPFYGRASAILAEGHLIALGERGGTLAVIKADASGWNEVSRCKVPDLSYPSWPAPVLSRKRLYLRDEDSLVCLDLATRGTR